MNYLTGTLELLDPWHPKDSIHAFTLVTVGSGFTPRNFRRRRQPTLSELKVWVSEGRREAAPHRRKRRIEPTESRFKAGERPRAAPPSALRIRGENGRWVPSPVPVEADAHNKLGDTSIRARCVANQTCAKESFMPIQIHPRVPPFLAGQFAQKPPHFVPSPE